MAPQLANDGYVSCTSHRAPAAGIQGQAVVTERAPHNVPSAANGGYVSCTSAVLADTTQQLADATQESDFDVALYAVVGTILNGCERDALTTHIMQP